MLDNEKDLFIKNRLQQDEFISKKADDLFHNFNTDEIEKCYFKGYVAQDIKVEEKEHKNSLFTISNDECEVLDEYEKKENVEEPDIKMPYYHFEEDGIVISN